MKLLIVNDAELETMSMKNNVDWKKYGIDQVFTAFCVEEGRQEITSHSIDVLLCDIEMPGENGLALIRWIRESGYDIDCILLTCHADFNYAREAIALNCRDYLLLPAKYEEIGECVLNICRRREERLQAKQLELYGQNWLKDKDETIQEQCCCKSKTETVAECKCYILKNISDSEFHLFESDFQAKNRHKYQPVDYSGTNEACSAPSGNIGSNCRPCCT